MTGEKSYEGNWCSAPNCFNGSGKNRNKSFFRFPKKKFRCEKWVRACRRSDFQARSAEYLYRNAKLCTDHFEDNMFANAWKSRLKNDAVPSIFTRYGLQSSDSVHYCSSSQKSNPKPDSAANKNIVHSSQERSNLVKSTTTKVNNESVSETFEMDTSSSPASVFSSSLSSSKKLNLNENDVSFVSEYESSFLSSTLPISESTTLCALSELEYSCVSDETSKNESPSASTLSQCESSSLSIACSEIESSTASLNDIPNACLSSADANFQSSESSVPDNNSSSASSSTSPLFKESSIQTKN